jgi:hypothetical protein
MCGCWEANPEDRPIFPDIVNATAKYKQDLCQSKNESLTNEGTNDGSTKHGNYYSPSGTN